MISRLFSRHTLLAETFLYALPGSLGLDSEDVEFWSRSGIKLRGWFLRGKKRGTVVFCSGTAGNVSAHLEYARMAARTGYSVLLFDYRGFGRSDGEPDLRSLPRDVEAACEFARFHAGHPVAIFGVSLGASAALAAAGAGAGDAAAVVAEGVCDLESMLEGLLSCGAFGPVRIHALSVGEEEALARERPRILGRRFPGPLARLCARVGAWIYPFEGKSIRRLARRLGEKPVFLIHGIEDSLLPFEAALDLHELLRGPRRLWLIPGIGHAQEPALACPDEYSALLGEFLDEAFRGRVSPPPAARLADLHAHEPATGCVSARIGVDWPPGEKPGENGKVLVLVTAIGGGLLRQSILDGLEEQNFEFPGPIEGVMTLRLAAGTSPARVNTPAIDQRIASFREMSHAANARDLEALDRALERVSAIERSWPFDFFAALYCLRAAQTALGGSPNWHAPDRAVARRSLESFLLLWGAHTCLPDEQVPQSPARWVKAQLEKL